MDIERLDWWEKERPFTKLDIEKMALLEIELINVHIKLHDILFKCNTPIK